MKLALAVLPRFDNSRGRRRRCRHAYRGIPIMDRTAYSELSLPDLRVLSALLRERSITRTAELMGTTQPAISKVLGRLRRQFSDPLFVRNGRVMQPTTTPLDIADRLHPLLPPPVRLPAP